MKTTRLDEKQFLSTFADPMRNVTKDCRTKDCRPIDIWPYVDSVPAEDLRGHEVYDRFVENVYRDATGRFDHVQVMTRTKNVYLIIVVDLRRDLKYGLTGSEG